MKRRLMNERKEKKMITLKNIGAKVATAMLVAGLGTSMAIAAVGVNVNVTLPESVSVGNTTLPSGAYNVTEVQVSGSESLFVFRDSKGDTSAVVPAVRDASSGE